MNNPSRLREGLGEENPVAAKSSATPDPPAKREEKESE